MLFEENMLAEFFEVCDHSELFFKISVAESLGLRVEIRNAVVIFVRYSTCEYAFEVGMGYSSCILLIEYMPNSQRVPSWGFTPKLLQYKNQ